MLYLFVLILSACALVYEFLLSTLSSYLVGNSVIQFSLTIGMFLAGIGIGAFLSRFVKNYKITFFYSEVILGVLGGFSVIIIKLLYAYFFNYLVLFYLFYFLIVIIIGALVGFEVPILGNLVQEKADMENKKSFKKIISDVFTYDYIGAILATFSFPFILLPILGLTYTSLLLGFFNLIVAFLFIYEKDVKEHYIKEKKLFKYTISLLIISVLYLFGAFFVKSNFENFWDHFFYKEPVVFKAQSKYQNIVITKRGDDIRLLLDGHLQFVSLDEKRYHDALWALGDSIIKTDKSKNNILILGGGDGLLARNVIDTFGQNDFKITLVDLDEIITTAAKTNNILLDLNQKSLLNPNVKIVNIDAFRFLSDEIRKKDFSGYDVIIADFTDPRDVGVSKLYSKEFYLMIKSTLKKDGAFITQSGNAFFAKESFWCINKTIKSVFNDDYEVIAYKNYIPSFGDWGFNAVIKKGNSINNFYENELVNTNFDRDYIVDIEKIKINTIENPTILNYYKEGRGRFNL